MLHQLIYRRNRRGVSPVIAMILIIVLALAAAATVVAVLNGVLGGSLGVDTDNVSLGSAGGSTQVAAPEINVTSIQRDDALESQGIKDYVEIKVDVRNVDDQAIYVFDIDLIVYGQKLDEIAQWGITSADGATYMNSSGSFGGFRQPADSNIRYTVGLSENDLSNAQARLPSNTTFVYQVLYGSQPDLLTGTVSKTKLSEVIFSPIFFDVAILHHGSSFASNDAATQYENTLKSLNGTNRIFFSYDRVNDSYDYQNNPSTIVGDEMIANYDVIIVDVWAVPTSIASAIQTIHNNATKMIFYGSVSVLGGSTSEIMNNIDVTTTEAILGITPNMFQGVPADVDVTDHSYQFFAGSSVLSGLGNEFFEEIEDDSYTAGDSDSQSPGICGETIGTEGTGIGDAYGYDIASFVGTNSSYIQYGQASFDFKAESGNALTSLNGYPSTGPLFVEKFGDTVFAENDTLAYSFIWKHNNALAPAGADLIDGSQLSQIRINMLVGAVGESSRTITYLSSSSVDSFNVLTPSQGGSSNKLFDMEIRGTVQNADIFNGSMTISVNMPEYEFHDCNPSLGKKNTFGTFFVNGIERANDIIVVIEADSIISIDISDYYDGTITEGSTFMLGLGVEGTEMFKISSDVAVYDWVVTIDTGSASSKTSATFQRAVDADTDQADPNQVTGLTFDGATATSIDISWDAASDNGGGVIDYYNIYRDDVLYTTTPSTSYTDSGLTADSSYTYEVSAVDDSGNEGPKSSSVVGSTFSSPPDVSGLSSLVRSSNRIDLDWDDLINVDGYRIYRNNTLISTLTNGSSYYHDAVLNPDTTYVYDVYGYNNSIESTNPATVTNTTDIGDALTGMYVQNMAANFPNGNPKGDVEITVTVYDEAGNPLSGVSVSIDFDDETGTTATYSSSGVTGADGSTTIYINADATLQNQGNNRDSWTATVTDISKTDYFWDNGSDVETSISGTAGNNVA